MGLLERLDIWIAILTLGALAYYELRLGRFIRPLRDLGAGMVERRREEVKSRRRRRPMRLTSRPIRGKHGQFNGSLPAVPIVPDQRSKVELRSEGGTALERGGTTGTEVLTGTITPAEIALIALRIGQGMAPSTVAKSLPGYSGRKYSEYFAKVEQVCQSLPEELAESAP